jgi:tRNA (cmo5U34)-methyltransferase
MPQDAAVWKSADLTNSFLSGVRGAIPLAAEQIDVMLRLVRAARPKVDRILDIGCGDGILGRALLAEFPEARGVLMDFSEPMIAEGKKKWTGDPERARFVVQDYGPLNWTDAVAGDGPFDTIVSGYSIHHQPDARKREIYGEIFKLLKPGGIFINIEHVSSRSPWVKQRFDDLFIDALYAYQQRMNSALTRDETAREFYNRPDKDANILAPVEDQCEWLREIGYQNVDIYMKIFELAVFGGTRP